MTSALPGQVGAVQVGSYFLGQYYHFLQQTPNLAHQFYTNASTMVRYDGATNESASGMAEIHNLIISLNFTEIEIKSAFSLESWDGGVLVTVTGVVLAKDFICRRKFVETFFLAPQEKGYFVLNDIFLLLEEEQVHQHSVAMLTHDDFETKLNALNPVQEPAVSNYMLGEDLPTGDFISSPIPADENNEVDDYSVSAQPNEVQDPDERVDDTPAELPNASVSSVPSTVQELPAFAEELVGDPPKHTYASILRTAKSQAAPHVISMYKPTPVLSEWHHAPQATRQQAQTTMPSMLDKSSTEVLDEVAAFEGEGYHMHHHPKALHHSNNQDYQQHIHHHQGESKSVYVGNLPASISAYDIEQEFKSFGRIKHEGVTIRSRKEAGVFYAFIEFEDAVGVQNALKASPVQLNGRLIHVEGRRPNSGASRGGRRGRGRGGYHSEIPRGGRFSGRSFVRGSGIDNDRDYSWPSSNGHLQRVPPQERGILGSQFPRTGGSS